MKYLLFKFTCNQHQRWVKMFYWLQTAEIHVSYSPLGYLCFLAILSANISQNITEPAFGFV